MKIIPSKGQIMLKFEEAKAGLLDTSSRESAVEYAEVTGVGEDITDYKKGDFVFVKSWAVDHVYHNDKHYTFVDIKTGGIKAIIK